MEIIISETKQELVKKAAQKGAELIRKAILQNGRANIIIATGVSQSEMLGGSWYKIQVVNNKNQKSKNK